MRVGMRLCSADGRKDKKTRLDTERRRSVTNIPTMWYVIPALPIKLTQMIIRSSIVTYEFMVHLYSLILTRLAPSTSEEIFYSLCETCLK